MFSTKVFTQLETSPTLISLGEFYSTVTGNIQYKWQKLKPNTVTLIINRLLLYLILCDEPLTWIM
jgi:hypothetical protein